MMRMGCDSIFTPETSVDCARGETIAFEGQFAREQEDAVDSNRKLGDAARRAAQGDAEAMGEVMEIGFAELEKAIHKAYSRYVVPEAGEDDLFESRTLELFLDDKFPSADDPSTDFLQSVADAGKPIGWLRTSAENFTIDRLRKMGIFREFKANCPDGEDGDEEGGSGIEAFGDDRPMLDDLDASQVQDQLAVVRALPLRKQALLFVVHIEYCMPTPAVIRHLAVTRDIEVADVQAELRQRYERITAARHEVDEERERRESWWYNRIRRLHIRLDVVKNCVHALDSGCEDWERKPLIGPVHKDLLEDLRSRADVLGKVSPAMRCRYGNLLADKLADAVERQSKLLREDDVEVAGGWNWEEVAVILGQAPADAHEKVLKTAANTVKQQHKRVRKKIHDLLTKRMDAAKQKKIAARKKASRS